MNFRSFVCWLFLVVITASTAFAQGPPPGYGDRLKNGRDWLSGNGVDIFSNGVSTYVYPGSIPTGIPWQCVELPQRLFIVRGWMTSLFDVNYAKEIYDVAANNVDLQRFANDGSYTPIPGDLVIFDEVPTNIAGHVAVVDTVESSRILVYEQNWDNINPSAWLLRNTDGSLKSRGSYSIRGYVHAKRNTGSPGGGSNTEIYVSESGNDQAGDGSSSRPFRTMRKAVEVASSTQPVVIRARGGNYPGSLTVRGKRIRIERWESGTAVIGR